MLFTGSGSCVLAVKSLGPLPSIEQNSANWYLRFISLWALSPGTRGKNCLVGLNCKQLSLWSAAFALTLFELCFPLAIWEPFALFFCVEKDRGCVLHPFFKVCCMFLHANPNTYSHPHFCPRTRGGAFRAVLSVPGHLFSLSKRSTNLHQFVNKFGRYESISVGSLYIHHREMPSRCTTQQFDEAVINQ